MSSRIEKAGVTAVMEVLNRVPAIDPDIDWNDRTLLTDGYIDVHEPGEYVDGQYQGKNTFVGRVLPQVKTSEYSDRESITNEFRMKRVDLEGYRKVGGVLFFRVGIIKKTRKARVLYVNLTPFAIRDLLRGIPETQNSVMVRLRDLPKDPAAIDRVVRYQHQAQAELHATGLGPEHLDRVVSARIFSDQPVTLGGPLNLDDPDRSYTIIATTRDGLTSPVDLGGVLIPEQYFDHEIEFQARSGDIVFASGVRRRVSDTEVHLRLSEGLLLRAHERPEGLKLDIDITFQPGLVGRLKDLEFASALERTGRITIGSSELRLDNSTAQSALQRDLEHHHRIHRVLTHFGADVDLVKVSEISQQSLGALDHLYEVLFENAEVHEALQGWTRFQVSLGDWMLELISVDLPTEGQQIISFLGSHDKVRVAAYLEGNEEVSLATTYDCLDADGLGRTINLHLDRITQAYDRIAEMPKTHKFAVLTLLDLIAAADAQPQRRDAFLSSAAELNAWIVRTQQHTAPEAIRSLVNELQIARRRGELNDDARARLRAARREALRGADDDGLNAAACAVLLGDIEEAQELLAERSESEREAFMRWPIGTLLTRRLAASGHTSNAKVCPETD